MAFPPIFDGAWDNTFPPDTQLANLLGQDLRTFRQDTQERFTALSGTLANRPTNMDAIFGGTNGNGAFGTIYIATDTSQIFQWSGAAWVDVTSVMVGDRLSAVIPVVTNGAGQDGVLVTIPAASLAVGMQIEIFARVSSPSNNSVALLFGATTLQTATGVNPSSIMYEAKLVVTGAATQEGQREFVIQETPNPTGTPARGRISPTEAIANAIVVKTRQTAATAGTVTHDYISVVWK